MPKDDKTKTDAAPAADTQNELLTNQLKDQELQIVALSEELAESREKFDALTKDLKKTQKALADATKALGEKGKQAMSAADMTAMINGKTVKIVRTVMAKFALDEVKKGFLDEDLELLVPERS